MRYSLLFLLLFTVTGWSQAQNSITINARLIDSLHSFDIEQEILLENPSKDTLKEIYLNDWANAFSSKTTPLAHRFSEEFARRFHFSRDEERGGTIIDSINIHQGIPVNWERPTNHPDLILLHLDQPLLPGANIRIRLRYRLKIPSDKFTRYGVDNAGNYKLRYWYINPAVYRNGWQVFSHRNLGNQFTPPADLDLTLRIPREFYTASALATKNSQINEGIKSVRLVGKQRVESKLYLTRTYHFQSEYGHAHEILTDIEDDGLSLPVKRVILDRVVKFLYERLGTYPHNTIFVTQEDYLNSPIYGLNQLPSFIRPFPDGFQYDLKQFKTITRNLLRNSILINPRKEQWVSDAMLVSLMMDYVDTYYPRMKLIGSLSRIIGIRWFHAADLEFNDQYQFLYMNMARLNLDQALTTAQDSLVKFNTNIANAYKAGIGMKYLEDFLGNDSIKRGIREFYRNYSMKPATANDFQGILSSKADKDIQWFFKDYVATNEKIDFTILDLEKERDSLEVTIKNKRRNNFPVSLYGLSEKDEVVFKTWVEEVKDEKTVKVPRAGVKRLALNYEGKIPEINQRDNYKGVTTLLNKPLQFRLLQDIEDPRYTQIFFMPEFDYNLYDGISIGPKMYNKTVLTKNFIFAISPKFGFTSKTLVGSASFMNNHQFQDQELHSIKYGLSGNRFSYGYDLFYEKFSPFLSFSFRNKYLRDNERQHLLIRNVNVKRDIDPETPLETPNYNVFNVNYRYSNPHLVDFSGASLDYQLAKNFSKVSLSLEYRKLFRSNRQINLRFFSGAFIYNDTDSDYFSFALDRPTDYLFDYNYYGRSQGSGLFSQQIIMAEGGFKSQLQPEFANQWLTSFNVSTNLWKWIFVYADAGLVKNKYEKAAFLYDSGLRLSLVDDYFEVFFPVYSQLGWEIAQENYDQKIRFIVSLDLNTLIKLFTRRWY